MRSALFSHTARVYFNAALLAAIAATTMAAATESSPVEPAIELAKRDLDVESRRAYGSEGPALAKARYRLAKAYREQEQSAAAIPLLTRALAIYDRTKPAFPPRSHAALA